MILACIDSSRYAVSVCDHAAWAAGTLDVPVELLHVLERPRTNPAIAGDRSGRLGVNTREDLLRQIVDLDEQRNRLGQQAGRLLLEEAAAQVRSNGIDAVRQRLAHGDLVEQIHDYERDARMIVIGKEGESKDHGARHLGANLERVIRTSHHPILVTSRAFQPIESFVLAFDGGASTGRAIDFLVTSSLLNSAEGRILFVGDGSETMHHRLNDAVARLRASGANVTPDARPGDPDTVIPQVVEETGAGMLLMGAYGHSRFREVMVGSTTTRLLQTSAVPLLVVR